MDPTPDGTAQDIRIAQIRLDAELARTRIAETIDALAYKADVPARLGDVLSTTASNITARVLRRIPSPSRTSMEAKGESGVDRPEPATSLGAPASTPHVEPPMEPHAQRVPASPDPLPTTDTERILR